MEIAMRSLLATILAALAFAGLTSFSAAAAAGGSLREAGRETRIGDRGTALHLARAVIGDDDTARPRRRWRADDSCDRPRQAKRRQAKPRHARTAKHARKHARKHSARQRRVMRSPARLAVRPYSLWRAPAGSGQHGVASYYWQGQRVASGGLFNPNGMTAAHRTLPFGTRVRVTHLGNGRSVEVRINDRGPYIAGRIIDLSRGAAGVIGMHGQGVARVRVTILGR
jgi:rare lipoprotein A